MSKKKSKSISNNNIKKERSLEWFYLLPLMFIVAILPLIVYAKIISLDDIERLNWKGGETNTDFFSYYKSMFFAASAFLSGILLVLLRLTGVPSLKKSKYYIPLGIYSLFVVISYFLSDFDIVAGRGFVEQFQGVWVMVAYGLVIATVINYVQNEKHVKLLIGSYIFVGILTAVIGMGQYFGHDFFRTDFGKYLILPENLHHIAETLEFKFKEREIYATMYNTNFVGSFADILLSLSVALFVYSKGLKNTALAGVFFSLMEMVWIGSNSRAGIVGFMMGIIFIVALFRKKIKKMGTLLVLSIVVMVGLNAMSDGDVFNEFLSLSVSRESEKLEERAEENIRIEDVKFIDNSIEIITENETLGITADGDRFSFYDGEGNKLGVETEGDLIIFTDEAYSNHMLTVDSAKGRFKVNVYQQEFMLYLTKEDGFKMRGSGGVLGTTEYPDRLEFMDGYERFATSRGYIWSRSIPLMKDTLLVGHGPDTYAIVFPQKDYVGKMNAYGNEAIVVDKPHNMFIQIGVNTGVVSLLALLSVFLMYFIDSMKLYWKRDIKTFLDHMGIGCVTAMISYLGAGFFNDQIISVAPLFYVVVGLGIAINTLVKNQIVGD
jgi:hypothetical protein